MFTFGFSADSETTKSSEKVEDLVWNTAKELACPKVVNVSSKSSYNYDIGDSSLSLLPSEEAIKRLSQTESCISEAEALHSDLVPAKYEGGLKVWECTEDLAVYLTKEKLLEKVAGKSVLDLGCGAGVLGILAMQHGATVHFQDYNEEVLTCLTMTNVSLNAKHGQSERCRYFCGDWQSFADLEDLKYELILSSETIYNPESQRKLLHVFKQRLSPTGVVLLAAKTYYFGVGGGVRQFEQLVQEDAALSSRVVWSCLEGVQREILKITWR